MLPKQIEDLKTEYNQLTEELEKTSWADLQKTARFGLLGKLMTLIQNYEKAGKRIAESQKLLDDPEMKELAEEEIKQLASAQARLLKEINSALTEKEPADKFKELVIEIRAGAGGEEASLFAADLYNMYSKYADRMGWPVFLVSSSKSELGGFKEIIFEIKSPDAYEKLRQESGVHRIQRVPKTEKSGRIHTSTASVAILPIYPPEAMEIKLDDLEISFTRSSGPGGQNVNKLETAVRITHKPTGLTVFAQNERSQAANRERAFEIMRAKLIDAKREKEKRETSQTRREQIGTADRSEKIRTYNFLQDRITDHRIKKSWHNIENILSGDLDPIINSFK